MERAVNVCYSFIFFKPSVAVRTADNLAFVHFGRGTGAETGGRGTCPLNNLAGGRHSD